MGSVASQAHAAEPPIDFGRQIRPILANNCLKCHGPDAAERQAGLRLDVRDSAVAAAESGEIAIVPGQAEHSELVKRVTTTDAELRMPPAETKKSLTEDEVGLLRRWVAEGAKYQSHWAFVAPIRPAIPDTDNASWPRGVLDRFVLSRLEREGVAPSAESTRQTLIRRLSLDLAGFPPALAEIDAFVADNRPDAYERLVDRLMASPHYGERMALDWLDAARFADTHGYHIDAGRDMTRWREYVIDAYNRNTPYDQFTVEQLAGDLLPETGDAARDLRQKLASGFNRNHMINFEGGAIPEEYLNAYIVDRVNTTGTVFLGLTVACTQCHDHKYDPITQREFYQLYAFFNNVPEQGLDGRKGNAAPLVRVPSHEQRASMAEVASAIQRLEAQIAAAGDAADTAQAEWEKSLADGNAASLPEDVAAAAKVPREDRNAELQGVIRKHYRQQVSPEMRKLKAEMAALTMRRDALDAQIPTSMVMQESPRPRETFLLLRGAYDKQGDKVEAAVPSFLPPLPDGAPANRLGLAQWLVDDRHPLTARVTVNRYWQLLFGTGLVKTAEDFGTQGELPSHPELLDWLAVEFQKGPKSKVQGPRSDDAAWDVKRLVRRLVSSSAYRQSSSVTPALAAKDPENRLLARGPRFRLPAEFIRDQALAVSGLYDGRIGGRSVSPYQPPGLWEELMSRADGDNWTAQKYAQDHGADLYRRTMYTFWKRTCPPPSLATLDAPDRETCTVRRSRTNTPLQALVLMNDPTYVEAARKFAERILREGGESTSQRLVFAFRSVTSRQPSPAELAVLTRVFERQRASFKAQPEEAQRLLITGESPADASIDPAELAAWTMVASAILNTDEAVTKG